jgi:hypothetical protein
MMKNLEKKNLRGARNGRIFTAEKKNDPEGLKYFLKKVTWLIPESFINQ